MLDELSCAQALVLKITEMTVEATGEPEANADEGEGWFLYSKIPVLVRMGRSLR